MDAIFKAIADPTRRQMLDRLFARDGQSLGSLCAELGISRQAASKHLLVLERSNLVAVRWAGREKMHFLNPVPIQAMHDRWIGKYRTPCVGALTGLKTLLEGGSMPGPKHVYVTYIRTAPEALWNAITQPEFTKQYFFGTAVESDWKDESPVKYTGPDGSVAVEGKVIAFEPPKRLVMSWRSLWSEALAKDSPSRVAWEIEPMGETCKLTLIHDEFDGETETYHETEGWTLVLSGLKTVLETGEPLTFEEG